MSGSPDIQDRVGTPVMTEEFGAFVVELCETMNVQCVCIKFPETAIVKDIVDYGLCLSSTEARRMAVALLNMAERLEQ